MEKVDIVIIGAGAVGLAIAARLSKTSKSLYVLERHNTFGQETSSRNSEVIHAGIYYPTGSLKARLCVEGNRMLYEICSQNGIGYRKIEKLIIATDDKEEENLNQLLVRGIKNGAGDLRILSKQEFKKIEPNAEGRAAIYSPNTGIVDTHALMQYLQNHAKTNGAEVVYGCNVVGLEKINDSYEVNVKESSGGSFKFYANIVINSAGLESDSIAQMVGIDLNKNNYRLKYCKGQYFRVTNSRKCGLTNRLIYPVPHEKITSLGVHVAKDLSGSMRLGPDAHYIDRNSANYEVDINQRKPFFISAKKLLPFLEEEDLMPDTAGIRPKLQGPDDDFRDFVIKEESNLGFAGFINLIGIESPGLTSAPAIAKYVAELVGLYYRNINY
jgi:L-2-hydroxyglutarate oxidase LhgO